MFKVHGVTLSPFVRKVLVTLEHKGQSYENERRIDEELRAAGIELNDARLYPEGRVE